MCRLVDSRDVLDPNARIRRPLEARVLGRYHRTGPNEWDPYQLVDEAGGPIQVLPGVEVQVEDEGAVFRIRQEGHVIRVRWDPGPEESAELQKRQLEPRQAFLADCVEDYQSPPALGLAAVIARKLFRKGRGRDK
jgi:hypothetical protein